MGVETPGSGRVILLGTSPIMMIKALHLHHRGAQVTLLERESHIGGSWYTRDLCGHKQVEFSVHELLERPRVYRFMEECLGLELGTSPEAHGRWGSRRFDIATYRLMVVLRQLLRLARAGDFAEAYRYRAELVRKLRYALVTTRYPVGGAVVMLQRLYDLLGQAGAPIRLGVTAESVDLQADRQGGVVHTSDGDLPFDQIVFGQSAHCPVAIDGVPFRFDAEERLVTTLLLHVEGEVLEDGPLYTWDDPIVRRYRNVGRFLDPPLPAGRALLGLSTRADRHRQREHLDETAPAALERMTQLGLVAPGTRLVDRYLESYRLIKIPRAELERMERALRPGVLPMSTWDLSECLDSMLQDPESLSLPRRARAQGRPRPGG